MIFSLSFSFIHLRSTQTSLIVNEKKKLFNSFSSIVLFLFFNREKKRTKIHQQHASTKTRIEMKKYQLIRLDQQKNVFKSLTSGLLLIFIFHQLESVSKFIATQPRHEAYEAKYKHRTNMFSGRKEEKIDYENSFKLNSGMGSILMLSNVFEFYFAMS